MLLVEELNTFKANDTTTVVFMLINGYSDHSIIKRYSNYTHASLKELKEKNPVINELKALSRFRRNLLADYQLINKLQHVLIYLKEKDSEAFEVLDNIMYQGNKGIFTQEEILAEGYGLSCSTIYNRLVTVQLLKITEAVGSVLPEGFDYTRLMGLSTLDEAKLRTTSILFGRVRNHYNASYIFCTDLLDFKLQEDPIATVYDDSETYTDFLETHFKLKEVKNPVVLQASGLEGFETQTPSKDVLIKQGVAGILYVDCDNTAYYGFLNLIASIKEEGNVSADHPLLVKLFIDPQSVESWGSRVDLDYVEFEYIRTPRLLESKSVVDLHLITSFIQDKDLDTKKYIVSSDSDFFLLHSLGYDFTVVYTDNAISNEYIKYLDTAGVARISIDSLNPSSEVLKYYVRMLLIQEVLKLLSKTPITTWTTSLKDNLITLVSLDRLLELGGYELSTIKEELRVVFEEVVAGVEFKNTDGKVELSYATHTLICE